ncbi:MAG: hypothetical protein M3170_10430 [Candidatus Dormibacteraeota bacterium]|nr:hypothetical protein [Candidatus Dormibacteraeota bacterium]MDQ6922005.1 hypothetical protein [Candidatus Dormibacteraeota bacterium]
MRPQDLPGGVGNFDDGGVSAALAAARNDPEGTSRPPCPHRRRSLSIRHLRLWRAPALAMLGALTLVGAAVVLAVVAVGAFTAAV